MDSNDLTIVIVTFNSELKIADCLKSIENKAEIIVVENSETRSQLDNKNKALQLLKSKLFELELREKQKQKEKIHQSKKKIEWGSQIRNYVFHPYQLVKDLRTGFSINNINSVMDGDLNDFIKSFLLNKT